MQFSIKNKDYLAKIDSYGGEIISFLDIPIGLEYIWQRDNKIWSNSAPILFPIVGRLKEGGYYYNEKRYNMDIHGFAKDNQFKCIKKTQGSLILRLTDTPLTQKQFPFSFLFNVYFSLLENGLLTRYEIKNRGNKEMYFSLGSHPGFRLLEDISFGNYYIEFEKLESLKRYKIINETLNKGEPYLKNKKIIKLNENLFNEDALIFKDIKSKKILLKNSKINHEILVDTGRAPYLGIWSKPPAPYVCIEPWWGCDDSFSSTGKLKEKEGIIKLKPKETFHTYYSFEIIK